jgi:hypothetical protein
MVLNEEIGFDVWAKIKLFDEMNHIVELFITNLSKGPVKLRI